MATLRRLAKTASLRWRNFAASRHPPPLLSHRRLSESPKGLIQLSKWEPDAGGSQSICPAILAGLFGAGVLNLAYADAAEGSADVKPPLPAESSKSYENLEEIAKKEKRRIEDAIREKGLQYSACPRFTVAVKGQKITIKFQVPAGCEVPQLIANLATHLGVDKNGGAGVAMSLGAWDSAVAWQLTLRPSDKQSQNLGDQPHPGDKSTQDGDLCILIFRSLITSDKAEIEFIKSGSLTSRELDALVSVLQLASARLGTRSLERRSGEGTTQKPPVDRTIASLESMGVRVYGLDGTQLNSANSEVSWDNIAGYDQQKREIEDTILLALQSPEVYDDIARGTRRKFESNRPRAVLFEGPPGTGKTSCARVIANQAGVPLMYVPLEIVMSKYYGESERLLGKVFSLANELPNGAIVFLDEVDSFAVARDNEMHEATRRILSVLLRQIDGFEQDKKVVVIAATNRKQDLDPALISRFDSMIPFGLPDHQNRQAIAAQYAKHLTQPDLIELANVTEEMSGRDIRDICQQAERSWASKIIRGLATKEGDQTSLPPLQEYIESAINRKKALPTYAAVDETRQNTDLLPKTQKLDLC